jgi:hypothetical protein
MHVDTWSQALRMCRIWKFVYILVYSDELLDSRRCIMSAYRHRKEARMLAPAYEKKGNV